MLTLILFITSAIVSSESQAAPNIAGQGIYYCNSGSEFVGDKNNIASIQGQGVPVQYGGLGVEELLSGPPNREKTITSYYVLNFTSRPKIEAYYSRGPIFSGVELNSSLPLEQLGVRNRLQHLKVYRAQPTLGRGWTYSSDYAQSSPEAVRVINSIAKGEAYVIAGPQLALVLSWRMSGQVSPFIAFCIKEKSTITKEGLAVSFAKLTRVYRRHKHRFGIDAARVSRVFSQEPLVHLSTAQVQLVEALVALLTNKNIVYKDSEGQYIRAGAILAAMSVTAAFSLLRMPVAKVIRPLAVVPPWVLDPGFLSGKTNISLSGEVCSTQDLFETLQLTEADMAIHLNANPELQDCLSYHLSEIQNQLDDSWI